MAVAEILSMKVILFGIFIWRSDSAGVKSLFQKDLEERGEKKHLFCKDVFGFYAEKNM